MSNRWTASRGRVVSFKRLSRIRADRFLGCADLVTHFSTSTKTSSVTLKCKVSSNTQIFCFPSNHPVTDSIYSSRKPLACQRIYRFSSAALQTAEDNGATQRENPHIRNVAIVAHVDHGKTTIVDELLKCTQNQKEGETGNLVMDCGDLERERGITITSKVTRMDYTDARGDEKIINVVDTVSDSFYMCLHHLSFVTFLINHSRQ